MGYESQLFPEEMVGFNNPFTGDPERGTPAYRYRWVSKQGEILYTDDEAFDPSRSWEYMGREWRRSLPLQPKQ